MYRRRRTAGRTAPVLRSTIGRSRKTKRSGKPAARRTLLLLRTDDYLDVILPLTRQNCPQFRIIQKIRFSLRNPVVMEFARSCAIRHGLIPATTATGGLTTQK